MAGACAGAEEPYRNAAPDGVSIMHAELLLGTSRFSSRSTAGTCSPR
ncbi:MAG TPA: hypothetical protein VKA84_19295 [Gemmatimonadaceae bacterium]|nr:hypothetical protein [Gemmatimonadaceae bacterium]